MDRIQIVQERLDKTDAKRYLEIGVCEGDSFLRIRSCRKIAVDPLFRISLKRKIKTYIKNPSNFFNRYFEVTSDAFFQENKKLLNRNKFDVIFLDGLHTYGQTLKDVQNSLPYLSEKGYLVLHDCNPTTDSMAYPAASFEEADRLNLPGWTGEWCGDVWKVIVHLRADASFTKDVCVMDCDYGVGVITNGKTKTGPKLDIGLDKIPGLSYEDLKRDRARLLNLKDP